MNVVCLLTGGPMRTIQVDGKRYEFEMHPYCGPTLLDKRGDPIDLDKHPKRFLYAASQWAQQGQRIEDGLCRWDHDPEMIIEKVGRMNFFRGEHPAKRGE